MFKNHELDSLKQREQEAFRRKQDAFQRYKNAKDRANDIHDEMELAWQNRCSAREEMNHEYEEMQKNSEHYRKVWNEYGRIRDYNNSRIESLRYEADREHQEMISCFDQASSEYEYGDKSMAPVYSQEGHEHKNRRDELNAEISSLANEIREARQNAEWHAPKTDSSVFHRTKEAFERAKSRHESIQAEFRRAKIERDRLKSEFDSLHAEHQRLKEEFRRKLEEIKVRRTAQKQQAVDKVNMALAKSNAHYLGSIFGHDAKIVPRIDESGKTDVYFGGLNAAGDGMGHGHAVIDSGGTVTYLRDAWVNDPKNDYLIDERADRYGKETHKI